MHHSDQEDVQMLKDWWKKYGKTILLGIAVFLGANFAWQYWAKFKNENLERASVSYLQMVDAIDNHKDKEFTLYADELLKNYKRTPYASLAAFRIARNAVVALDFAVALKNLHWVLDNSHQAVFRQIARLRIARILLAERQYAEALAILKKVDDVGYQTAVEELKGDILLQQKQPSEAVKAYQEAWKVPPAQVKSPLLKMKIEEKAEVPAGAAEVTKGATTHDDKSSRSR